MTATLAKFDFKPGFNRESTQYAEEGKWYDGNRVRFRSGKPENMRGYTTKVPASTGKSMLLLVVSLMDLQELYLHGEIMVI